LPIDILISIIEQLINVTFFDVHSLYRLIKFSTVEDPDLKMMSNILMSNIDRRMNIGEDHCIATFLTPLTRDLEYIKQFVSNVDITKTIQEKCKCKCADKNIYNKSPFKF
jgi:hypothetical protein